MVEVTDVPSEQRYVISVDGSPAGRLDYKLAGNVFVALHTEIDPAYEGQGLASVLVQRVLDDVRAAGRGLRPRCPYVRSYLDRHPEYADLVPSAKPSETEVTDGEGAR